MPHLTDAYVDSLPPAKDERGYVVHDDETPGFIVRVGRKKKTYRFQIAHRVGDQRLTISKNLGSRPQVKATEARAAAKVLDGERLSGKVPVTSTMAGVRSRHTAGDIAQGRIKPGCHPQYPRVDGS
jgi:Arm domain-containing DNA-binding protein